MLALGNHQLTAHKRPVIHTVDVRGQPVAQQRGGDAAVGENKDTTGGGGSSMAHAFCSVGNAAPGVRGWIPPFPLDGASSAKTPGGDGRERVGAEPAQQTAAVLRKLGLCLEAGLPGMKVGHLRGKQQARRAAHPLPGLGRRGTACLFLRPELGGSLESHEGASERGYQHQQVILLSDLLVQGCSEGRCRAVIRGHSTGWVCKRSRASALGLGLHLLSAHRRKGARKPHLHHAV